MAVDTFIPEVWAATLLAELDRRHIFAQAGITNRNYEGDIASFGDTVRINQVADPTIGDYVKNVTVIDPEVLDTTDQTLVIDQSKFFAFEVDDVDARQVRNSGALMTEAAHRSAQGLAQAMDVLIATRMTTGAGTILAPQAAATPDAAYLLVRQIMVALDKNDVPADGRFLTVSPDFYALLLGDDRFIDASRYGSTSPIRNGEVGSILGFSVIKTNNSPEGTAATAPAVSNFVIGGHAMATTVAEQISKVEAYRPQGSFSDALKGLHLYGSKVVRPAALVACDVDVTLS